MPEPDPQAFTRDLEDALTQLDAGDMALDEAQEQIQQAHERHLKALATATFRAGQHMARPRFDRTGFMFSLAGFPAEELDLSKLADLAEAAIVSPE